MSGLLSMIGMKAKLDYLIGDFAACFGDTTLAILKGSIHSDKQKCQLKASMSLLSRELKSWQLLRRMLSKSLIIVKSKTYGKV